MYSHTMPLLHYALVHYSYCVMNLTTFFVLSAGDKERVTGLDDRHESDHEEDEFK